MPRVESKKKGGGKTRHCAVCQAEIIKGERYYTFAFRYGGRRYHCKDHRPKRSQLTQSKLSAVYEAIEAAEENIGDVTTVEDAEQMLNEIAEVVREVAEEYREAAEPFGGAGENADRADELEGFADELEGASFDAADPEEPEEVDEDQLRIDLSQELFGIDTPDALEPEQVKELDAAVAERVAEMAAEGEDEDEERAQALQNEVQDYLNNCPL